MYFKCLLRGSLLHATEVMFNWKETDIKLIEKSEESTLQDLIKNKFSASRHLVYLELGVIPARYVLKKRKIMYLKKILNSQNNSLLK